MSEYKFNINDVEISIYVDKLGWNINSIHNNINYFKDGTDINSILGYYLKEELMDLIEMQKSISILEVSFDGNNMIICSKFNHLLEFNIILTQILPDVKDMMSEIIMLRNEVKRFKESNTILDLFLGIHNLITSIIDLSIDSQIHLLNNCKKNKCYVFGIILGVFMAILYIFMIFHYIIK